MRPLTPAVHLLYMAGFVDVDIQSEVVRDLVKGKPNAQESIYRDFSKPVYSMALQILRNVQLAEDVTHDTFVDVFTNTSKLRDHTLFAAWIRKIAVNRCLMVLRSSSYKNSVSTDSLAPKEISESTDHESAIDIERALKMLKPTTRMIVWLYVVEGYTHLEIGQLFDKSQSYSKSKVSRALASLREVTKSNHTEINDSPHPRRRIGN